jgi:hypothetical protein
MSDANKDAERAGVEADELSDLELSDDAAAKVVGGANPKAVQKTDGSLDAGIHFKYDLKAQKE